MKVTPSAFSPNSRILAMPDRSAREIIAKAMRENDPTFFEMLTFDELKDTAAAIRAAKSREG